MSFVDSTVKDIDNRLKELQQEVSRLEAARSALVGSGGSRGSRGGAGSGGAGGGGASATSSRRGSGRRARTTSRSESTASRQTSQSRRPGRPRGRRGGNTRSNQALELVRGRPGITIPQIAEQLKIEPNYLYRVMPKLLEEGLVSREGQGWHPAAKAE